MREEGYRSVQIRKPALAALESTAVRLSVSALAIYLSLRRQCRPVAQVFVLNQIAQMLRPRRCIIPLSAARNELHPFDVENRRTPDPRCTTNIRANK
jgi:hypothetical protein